MKKVILVSPAFPLRGGIATSTERLAQELVEQGYDAQILSFSLQYPKMLFPGKTQYVKEGTLKPNLTIHTRLNSINPFNWWSVGKWLKKENPDIIVIRYWLPFMAPALGTIARIAKRNTHTKVIALADNILPHEARMGDRQLTNYFVKTVDAFLVMSKTVETEVAAFAKGKPIRYVPHPIYDNYGQLVSRSAALHELGLDANYRYILFFGFIRPYKGLDLLIKALSDPRLREMPIKLLVAGEFYSDEEAYWKLIQMLKLEDRIQLHNEYIPHEEVKLFFGAADLVVQPYKTASQSGISQLAYHFEKPMVVTNVGGLPEIIQHDVEGYVVDVDEVKISDAIHDFFSQNRLDKMVAAVRNKKSEFAWDKMVDAIEELQVIVGDWSQPKGQDDE